jgi:A/G-specific adenine glycosylase
MPANPAPARNVTALQRRLLRWYRKHGRSTLPWRVQRSPYRTVVSEFMLAQTQVDRVVPKFEAFVARFPHFAALAAASTADVLREWRGLGYNSRAVRLQQLARIVVERYGGVLPSDSGALRALPGVGPYTAAATRAFGFNIDDAPLDTNIARIVRRLGTRATAIELVPKGRAHDWNSALMDLGAMICTARTPKCLLCPLRLDCAFQIDPKPRSAAKSIPFKCTVRYVRGRIVERLRDLPPGRRISLLDLHADLARAAVQRDLEELRTFVSALERDGLVSCNGNGIALRE